MEKLTFALITTSQKLRPYFQAHTIVVQTNKPLRKAINNPKATGGLVLRVIELAEFNVQYRHRTAIEAQALADFITEFRTKEDEEVEPTMWMIWTDGSSNQRAGEAGVQL